MSTKIRQEKQNDYVLPMQSLSRLSAARSHFNKLFTNFPRMKSRQYNGLSIKNPPWKVKHLLPMKLVNTFSNMKPLQ